MYFRSLVIIHRVPNLIFVFVLFLRQSLTLAQAGVQWITVHCSLDLLGSSDPPISASQIAGTIGMCHHTHLIFVFFIEMGFAMLPGWSQTTSSSDLPTSACQKAELTAVHFFSFSFFSVCFILGQYCYAFTFTDPFFLVFHLLPIQPCTDFISDNCVFISRNSIWVF